MAKIAREDGPLSYCVLQCIDKMGVDKMLEVYPEYGFKFRHELMADYRTGDLIYILEIKNRQKLWLFSSGHLSPSN